MVTRFADLANSFFFAPASPKVQKQKCFSCVLCPHTKLFFCAKSWETKLWEETRENIWTEMHYTKKNSCSFFLSRFTQKGSHFFFFQNGTPRPVAPLFCGCLTSLNSHVLIVLRFYKNRWDLRERYLLQKKIMVHFCCSFVPHFWMEYDDKPRVKMVEAPLWNVFFNKQLLFFTTLFYNCVGFFKKKKVSGHTLHHCTKHRLSVWPWQRSMIPDKAQKKNVINDKDKLASSSR